MRENNGEEYNPMHEFKAPFIELTTSQAAKIFGISEGAMRRRCEQGLIDSYRTDGGRWLIKLRPTEVMPKEEAEAILRENTELKARLEAAKRVLAG
jgi:predicted site-specific integrase-resolvase